MAVRVCDAYSVRQGRLYSLELSCTGNSTHNETFCKTTKLINDIHHCHNMVFVCRKYQRVCITATCKKGVDVRGCEQMIPLLFYIRVQAQLRCRASGVCCPNYLWMTRSHCSVRKSQWYGLVVCQSHRLPIHKYQFFLQSVMQSFITEALH